MKARTQPCKFKMFALVRDKHGKVKFDDWFNIPDEIGHALTDEDWEYIHQKRLETQKET